MGVEPPRCPTAGMIRENANRCTTSTKLSDLEFILEWFSLTRETHFGVFSLNHIKLSLINREVSCL